MIRWSPRSYVAGLRASVLAVLIVLGYFLFSPRHDTKLPTSTPSPLFTTSESCPVATSAENVVVSIKTGASEAAQKVPALMQSSLRCAKNTFIFSDLEQDIGDYHLYDALDTVPASMINTNTDFEFYKKQRELWQTKQNIDTLKDAKNPKDPEGKSAAWTLDKYKFIHVLEKTWALKPDMDWYILIDADTYIVWPSMLLWLDGLDPKKKSYFGSEVNIGGVRFAHGGSGIVLSKGLMQELFVSHNDTATRWDAQTSGRCCGDLVLSMALGEYGIELQDVWPLMSGERPSTMPFGPGTPEYWCRPALSFHHLTPVDMKEFAQFEKSRLDKLGPWTHMEFFNDFVRGSLPDSRENWDNVASDPGEFGKTGGVESNAASFEDCAQACEANKECFQYSHHGDICYIGMSVRLGYKKEVDQEGTWRSGWNKTRLADWASKQPICKSITFPKQKN
ncbi:hypothetical protein LSUB1_G003109 [Lachnellula subtilissima]|uniref:N-acetylgalactosaminide beta-1,3-galactosyltransferase n=1 Tax=Lachnellula subtilissima TaxID=602034 RepID=A0A8H8RSG4_9HELO|nr:hypothetical protein LSUB1_G003109 [Lachnellula subtilissima]